MALKKIVLPAIAAMTVAGGAAAYFHLNRASGDSLSPTAIAQVIPDEAYLAAFISQDDNDWAKLKKFGTPEAQASFEKGLQDFKQKMAAEWKVDVDKDLKPWMGNMMFAVMPSADPKKPELVMAIAIKDKMSALSFANKVKSDGKAKTTEIDYKGIKINQVQYESAKEPSYTAVLKDAYLVMASDKGAIEQAIEAAQGNASFASNPETSAMLSEKSNETVLARFYVPNYAGLVTAMSSGASTPINPEALKWVKSMSGNVTVTDVGLRLKGAMKLDPKIAFEFKPTPGKVVSQFPADTFALISGNDISSSWKQVTAQSQNDREIKKIIDMMRGGSQAIGLDLDNDIFGWMNGEFAIGMAPNTQGMMAQLGFGQAMVFQTSDRKTAEATLSKLDTLAKNQSMSIAQREVNGKKVTDWNTPQGMLLSHGWLDDNTMFVAIGDQLVSALSNSSDAALDSNDQFKTATASLPKQNVGYFFMDVEKVMGLTTKFRQATQTSASKPNNEAIVNSIKSIGGTTTQTDKTTSQFEVVFALKPAK